MPWKELFRGIPQIGRDPSQTLLLGTNRCVELNASDEGEYMEVPDEFQNGRVVYCDVAGVARFSYYDDSAGTERTETMYMNAGTFYQIRNLRRVYRELRSGAVATAKIYIDFTGTTEIGLKVRR